jgi:hypothetical protein
MRGFADDPDGKGRSFRLRTHHVTGRELRGPDDRLGHVPAQGILQLTEIPAALERSMRVS